MFQSTKVLIKSFSLLDQKSTLKCLITLCILLFPFHSLQAERFKFEAESLSSSGEAQLVPFGSGSKSIRSHAEASSGAWLRLDSNQAQSYEWLLGFDVPSTALYEVRIGYRQAPKRAVAHFQLADTSINTTVDQVGIKSFQEVILGDTILEAGQQFIQVQIAESQTEYYRLSIDYIEIETIDNLVSFKVLHEGSFTLNPEFTGKSLNVFHDSNQYAAELTLYSNEPPSEVDFASQRVVKLDMGYQTSGGYLIQVNRIEEQQEAIVMHVEYQAPSCGAAGVITQPFTFLRVNSTKTLLLNETFLREPCLD